MRSHPERFVFAATTPNIGTTTLAIQHALALAKVRERRVVFVCLNLKSSHAHTYFGVRPKVTFDQLLPDVQARCLTDLRLAEALLRPVRSLPNLRMMCGQMQRECAELVHADDIAYFLERVCGVADDVVIDVHAHLDNAATLHTLTQPWTRYCVTNADIHRFAHDYQAGIDRVRSMYRLPIAFDRVYVRAGQSRADRFMLQQIGKAMGVADVRSIPEYEGLDVALRQGQFIEALMRLKGAA